MSSIKKLIEETRASVDRLGQMTMQAPVQVTIKEWYPQENKGTVQLVSPGISGLDRASIGTTKFPILNAPDGSMSLDIQEGSPAVLFYAGWQIKRGYVVLGHSEGDLKTTTYTPVRWSWAVG